MPAPGQAPPVLLCANTGTQHYTYSLCTEPHNQTQIEEKKGREKLCKVSLCFIVLGLLRTPKKYIYLNMVQESRLSFQ